VTISLKDDFGSDFLNPPNSVKRESNIACASNKDTILVEKSILKENNTLVCTLSSRASSVSEKSDLGLYIRHHSEIVGVPSTFVSIHGEDDEETEVIPDNWRGASWTQILLSIFVILVIGVWLSRGM
jgi:hypothetical protein